MDLNSRKLPKVPSKSESYALVLSKGQQKMLTAHKDELDKQWHTEARSLQTSRNRFVLDRRRSMGYVYNSLVDGTWAPKKLNRRTRRHHPLDDDGFASDPEVIDIFRKQEARRKSLKAAEEAVNTDALRMLERKYQKAVAMGDDHDYSTGEDEDEEDETKEEKKFRAKIHKRRVQNPSLIEGKPRTFDEESGKKISQRKPQPKFGRQAENDDDEKSFTGDDIPQGGLEDDYDDESEIIVVPGLDFVEPGFAATEDDLLPRRERKVSDIKRSMRFYDLRSLNEEETVKDNNSKESLSSTNRVGQDHSSDQGKIAAGTSMDANDKTTAQHIPKLVVYEHHSSASRIANETQQENKVNEEGDAADNSSKGETGTNKQQQEHPPRRKRSHSDGNIVFTIFDLKNKDLHPFLLAKMAAQQALENSGRSGEEDEEGKYLLKPQTGISSEDVERKRPESSRTYVIDSEHDVSRSPRTPRRRVAFIEDDSSSGDEAIDHRRSRNDFRTSRTKLQNEVAGAPSRHREDDASDTEDKIHLSPSLRRRITEKATVSPIRTSETSPIRTTNVLYSSLTRRRADVKAPSTPLSSADEHEAAQPVSHSGADMSPRLSRRAITQKSLPQSEPLKDEMPDKSNSQHKEYIPSNAKDSPRKPRPLRRSRSEAIDLFGLLTFREGIGEHEQPRYDATGRAHFLRRGSDSRHLPSEKTSSSRLEQRRGSDLLPHSLGGKEFPKRGQPKLWDSLMFSLILGQEEKEAVARHKRNELLTSLRKRQQEVDGDVSKRIKAFLERYEDC